MLIAHVHNQRGGTSPQLWDNIPNEHSDYWNPKRSGIDRIVGGYKGFSQVETRHEHLPLAVLADLYPPKQV